MSPVDLGRRGPKPSGARQKCGACNGAGTQASGSGRNRVETTCLICSGTGEVPA